MESINIRIKRSTYDRIRNSGTKLSVSELIDLMSYDLSSGRIDLEKIKIIKDQVINKAIEVALKKEQSLNQDSVPEAAGMSYSKTGWADSRPDPIPAKTFSMMDRG